MSRTLVKLNLEYSQSPRHSTISVGEQTQSVPVSVADDSFVSGHMIVFRKSTWQNLLRISKTVV